MAGCCASYAKFDGVSKEYKRRLWIVIAINALMFFVEMSAGRLAQSQALQADALDFLGDALTYGLSLAVIGSSIAVRTNAALFKGFSLLAVGAWVFGSTVYRVFYGGVPAAEMSYKDGDANVRSVWLCSRNDAIGNIAVMFAALGVWGTASGWPDLIVAGIMASLFLSSAIQIIKQSLDERRDANDHQHQAG